MCFDAVEAKEGSGRVVGNSEVMAKVPVNGVTGCHGFIA